MARNRAGRKPFKKSDGGGPAINPDLQCPVFSFEDMRENSGYSVSCCIQEDQAALSKRLFKLSQMTWRSIRQADRHGLGFEKISRNSVRVGLPAQVTADVTLIAFRFSGMKPMLGYRDGRIFKVLILDHTFDAYDHG